MPFWVVINGLCPSWHWLSWVTDPSSAQNCTTMSSRMQILIREFIAPFTFSKTRQLLQLMTTMNTHNPALMQSWRQSPKMMNTMIFVEEAAKPMAYFEVDE